MDDEQEGREPINYSPENITKDMNPEAHIETIMTSRPITIGPDQSMDRVHEIFCTYNIHHIPVVDPSDRVVGMISKADYYKLQNSFTLFGRKQAQKFNQAVFESILVKEVMSPQLVMLHPEDEIGVAAGIFKENLFHAIPIVDEDKRLVGILSTYDLLSYAFWLEIRQSIPA